MCKFWKRDRRRRVKTWFQLIGLSMAKKSVICPKHPTCNTHKPAKFVLTMGEITVYEMFDLGLYVYEKKR